MVIDWFTVGAQTLNFLILVWLLKRFLYQPILDGIDAREKGVAVQLAQAHAQQISAARELSEYQKIKAEFVLQRQALLQDANAAAERERQRLFAQVRAQANELSLQQQAILKRERQQLEVELRHFTLREVFSMTRKTLSDLAGVSLEKSMTEVFLNKVRTMDASSKEKMSDAIFSSLNSQTTEPVLIRTAFELSEDQKAEIQTTLNEVFDADVPIEVLTAPEVITGIELNVNGQKMGWSTAEYMLALEHRFEKLLALSGPEKVASETSEEGRTA